LVPGDLQRLRRTGAKEGWSFARALVAFRPAGFVLTDPVRHKQRTGVRVAAGVGQRGRQPVLLADVPNEPAQPVDQGLCRQLGRP
jgi:hypothetical protein